MNIMFQCHFGSVPGLMTDGAPEIDVENTSEILKQITRDFDKHPNNKVTVWVNTYRMTLGGEFSEVVEYTQA